MCAAPVDAPPRRSPPVRADWLSKTLAGLGAGLALALAASGLLLQALSSLPLPVRGQLAMWAVPPVWMVALSGVYFFGSGRRAWLWLGAACVLAWGVLLGWRLAA